MDSPNETQSLTSLDNIPSTESCCLGWFLQALDLSFDLESWVPWLNQVLDPVEQQADEWVSMEKEDERQQDTGRTGEMKGSGGFWQCMLMLNSLMRGKVLHIARTGIIFGWHLKQRLSWCVHTLMWKRFWPDSLKILLNPFVKRIQLNFCLLEGRRVQASVNAFSSGSAVETLGTDGLARIPHLHLCNPVL